ncbi:MAG: ABC transporter ATP-binding protein, partial [Actinomycetota bacterium]
SIDVRFGRAVPSGAFEGLPGVKEATVREAFAHFVVEGSIDALVKVAAQFEVLDIVSEEADLEEIFLTYYRGDEEGA